MHTRLLHLSQEAFARACLRNSIPVLVDNHQLFVIPLRGLISELYLLDLVYVNVALFQLHQLRSRHWLALLITLTLALAVHISRAAGHLLFRLRLSVLLG